MIRDDLDGCGLDFDEPLDDDDREELLVPASEEVDEDDDDEDGLGDRGIATRLRAAGLTVREVKGWKTRGRDFAGASPSFSPLGSVNHHTAGPAPATGRMTPSLSIIINGRPDLNGPLANVYQGFDDVAYVVAAGVANHAGLPDGGVCRGMHGNSQAYGLEVEHPGTSPLSKRRVKIAARIHAALIWKRPIEPRQVVQHWEWAPSRKIDLATNLHGATPEPSANRFRSMVGDALRDLEAVHEWTVSYLTRERERREVEIRDVARWFDRHPGALQRGRIHVSPIRR